MRGLIRGTVSVEEHDGAWAREAEDCIALLKEILREDAVDIRHVGSTAIAGICAKPIIDIAVAVNSPGDVSKHDAELAGHGIYFRKREHGEQLLYVCGDPEKEIRTHHIHVVLRDSEARTDYLNFRDYMNCHPEEARAYAQLKKRLAALYPEDRAAYTEGKREFIGCVLQKAAAWRDGCR